MITDCNDTVESVYSTKQNPKGGRILVEIAKIKEAIERKEIERVKWVPTQSMLADVLTKRGVNKAEKKYRLDFSCEVLYS